MAKLIVIAGIKRSGSTWLYNAVRLCLKHAGYSVHIAGDGQYYDPDTTADYQIVKKHPFDPVLAKAADYVFMSDRDDEGIRASWERFKGEKLTDETLRQWRGWLLDWISSTNTMLAGLPVGAILSRIEYDDINSGNVNLLIRYIIDRLNLSRDSRYACRFENSLYFRHCVIESLQDIKPPTDRDYDPETFFFRNHITSR